MKKNLLNYIIIFICFITIGINVDAASPSCYKCILGATTVYNYDYNVTNETLRQYCTKTDESYCKGSVNGSSSETVCIYKDSNGNTIKYILNHNAKTVSNPPELSYKNNCHEYVENPFSEYASFVPEGSKDGKATCSKFEKIYANVPSSYSSCSIDWQGWSSSNEFKLSTNTDTTSNNNSKYCLYNFSSDRTYFELKDEGINFGGTYNQYEELMITVDLKNEKITTNNIESVLAEGTHLDRNFTFNDLIDQYNKCTKKLYWNDDIGSSTIDNEKHPSNPPTDNDNNGTNSDSNINFGDQVEVNCEGILGQELIDFLNKIFHWIQLLAPIFVIIISGIDFAGALLQDDKDSIKKASNKFIKRLIIAVALFFIPLILSWLLNIFNDITGAASSTCGIGE